MSSSKTRCGDEKEKEGKTKGTGENKAANKSESESPARSKSNRGLTKCIGVQVRRSIPGVKPHRTRTGEIKVHLPGVTRQSVGEDHGEKFRNERLDRGSGQRLAISRERLKTDGALSRQ